jgi:hypothetical protein
MKSTKIDLKKKIITKIQKEKKRKEKHRGLQIFVG